jgi:2-oxoglutarate dehydrogenase E2 component (dihydrolipoamide succinyltransferase)
MPIINQPEVAILGFGMVIRKPTVVTLPDGSEAIAIRPLATLAISWDHRAVDGAYATTFLRTVKRILETRDWTAELS